MPKLSEREKCLFETKNSSGDSPWGWALRATSFNMLQRNRSDGTWDLVHDPHCQLFWNSRKDCHSSSDGHCVTTSNPTFPKHGDRCWSPWFGDAQETSKKSTDDDTVPNMPTLPSATPPSDKSPSVDDLDLAHLLLEGLVLVGDILQKYDSM